MLVSEKVWSKDIVRLVGQKLERNTDDGISTSLVCERKSTPASSLQAYRLHHSRSFLNGNGSFFKTIL